MAFDFLNVRASVQMAICPYCGKSAGLMRKVHNECKDAHDAGWTTMVEAARDVAQSGERLDQLEETLRAIGRASYVPETNLRDALVAGWERALDVALEDSVLTEIEEIKLGTFAQHFKLGQDELNHSGAWTRASMAGTLRDILEGRNCRHVKISGSMPFNFLKSESLVWAFPNTSYLEDRTRRQYVGASQGLSIRVMKGVYYRTGMFRGRPIDTTERVNVDSGLFAITTQHLYFHGSSKRFRIPYTKVVSFEPYSDGIGVQRDAASAKPQTFVTGNGWFVFNAVTNLAKGI